MLLFNKIFYRQRRILWFAVFKLSVVSLPMLGTFLWCVLFPTCSFGYVFRDDKRGTELSIFGLGMVRLNYANIDGDVIAFEDSDEGFAEDFDSQELLSLAVNGVVFRDYALEGELRYNQDDDPDWNFLFKLSRDEQYVLFGDQPNIFPEPYFTRYTNPFRGLTLHAETERIGMTTFGAITRGVSEKEEITPDGTSGPYELNNIPVVPGSDIVTIEVRNRNDPNQVLETIPQVRNVDYTIDYDTGEISFARPVDNETFSGDLVVIVVIYRTESESSSFLTGIAGGRVTLVPNRWTTFRVTYVSEFDRDPSISDGFDQRQEVYGVDGTFTLGEFLTLKTEYAFSQDHQETEDSGDIQHAFLTTLDGNLGDKVDLYGKYRLAERDFLTFANPDITTDEQELEFVGKYSYRTNHSLEAGYSFWQDNLSGDPASPSTTIHRPYLGWDAFVREQTELYSKYEYIQTQDDLYPKETDQHTHTFLFGAIQEFLSAPVVKKLILRAEYQLRDFEDVTDQESDTITHQLGLRARSEPAKNLAAYVEQRERLIHDKDVKQNTERQDISEIGVELDRWERFSAESKYQYKVTHDLLFEEKESEKHTVILSSKYQPFDVLNGSGKIELRDETLYTFQEVSSEDSEIGRQRDKRSSQAINLEGRLLYTPKKDLSVRLRYEYEQSKDDADLRSTTREDETELRVNYAFDERRTRLTGVIKVERDLLDAPPTPETKTRTMTYFASAVRQLTDQWDLLTQYKREVVELSADNFREDILGEVGYNAGRFLKFVGGYQYSKFHDSDDSTNNYTANSIYIKIIGKL